MEKNKSLFYASSRISGINFKVFSSGKGIHKILINPKDFNLSPNIIKLHPDDPFMFNIFNELGEYFSNARKKFDVPLEIEGTEFQKNVWKEVNKIPFGKTISYKNIALKLGSLSAVRAVGGAVGANPVPIVIPCHRVIDSSGNLRGYSAGLSVKEKLLELEGLISLELFDEVKTFRIQLNQE